MSGWVKLHRQMLKWEWYSDHNTSRLFIHLLITANYEPSRYKGHAVPAGSLVAGHNALSRQTGLSVRNIRTALEHLKSTNEVTINSTNLFSIISITNWEEYQSNDKPDDKPLTIKRQASDKRPTTSKETKNIRIEEIKNISLTACPADVSQSIWEDHLKNRKAKRQPITDTALDGMRREADKAGLTLEQALTEACQRGWASFKAEWIKETKNGNNQSKSKSELADDALNRVFAAIDAEEDSGTDPAELRYIQHIRTDPTAA